MRIAVACLLLTLIAGCKPIVGYDSGKPAPMTHVVICWLKEPGNMDHTEQLIQASYAFQKLPGVVSVFAGTQKSGPTTRPIEDTSFDVMVVMTFNSPDALERYQQSDEHKQAVKNVLQPLTRKVIVYDALDYGEFFMRRMVKEMNQ